MTYNGILRKINGFLSKNIFYLNDLNRLKAVMFDLSENNSMIIGDFKYIFETDILNKIINENVNPLYIKTLSYDIFYNKYKLRVELSKRLAHLVSSLIDVNVINIYNHFLACNQVCKISKDFNEYYKYLEKVNIGDEVVFGKYDNDVLNWIVLDKNEEYLFLCLNKYLDFSNEKYYSEDSKKSVCEVMIRKKFSSAHNYLWHKLNYYSEYEVHKMENWENSGYRKLLNYKFYNEAFSDSEKKIIQLYKTNGKCIDLVFLLKIEEVFKNYYLLNRSETWFSSLIYQEKRMRKHKIANSDNGYLYINESNYWDFSLFNPCIIIKIKNNNKSICEKPLETIVIGKEVKSLTNKAILECKGFDSINNNKTCKSIDTNDLSKSNINLVKASRVMEQNKRINYIKDNYLSIFRKKIIEHDKKFKSILKPFGRYKDIDLEWELYSYKQEDNAALFVLKYCLGNSYIDTHYSVSSWEDTFLCKWLNDGFYNNAFNYYEKKKIIKVNNKYISLLGNWNMDYYKYELCHNVVSRQYKFDSKSRYSCSRKKLSFCSYWLNTIDQNKGYYVDKCGRVNIDYITNIHGVRPVMWVRLD